MILSLSEAARLLGKSDRQVRYMIRSGKLRGQMKDGRWRIRREDLPLSGGQVRAARQKAERAAKLASEILKPDAEEGEPKKSYSIRQLRAFQVGVPLYRELTEAAGMEHPATGRMREALMLLACGYNEFDGNDKAALYTRARHEASRAAMALLLDSDDSRRELADRLEAGFLPALGGLIRKAQSRGRKR